ncbi:MAG: response regulator receiver protein [Bryobacterales bacterium]|nr:response regulator receiver protein [Bryobacterales bacterium]
MSLNILLAEDNPGDVFLVRRALNEHHVDFDLHVVRDGAEALEFVTHMGHPGEPPCPDVVLLDLDLPKVDGSEILRAFRTRPECRSTPVVVVSSSDSQRDRARVIGLGSVSYFRKPSELDEFMLLGALVARVAGHI